jgi:pyruvate/2-oxoglutarate dehydrogenase complex dihydrolipoamide acyltransferase (E2) component
MLQAPGEAAGSFLMAPGEVFASLAVAVVDAQRATMRRRAQAWVRLRELVRKAASRFLTAPCEVFASLTVAHFGATAAQATQPAGSFGASTGGFGSSSWGMFDAVVATVTQVAPSCPQWAGQIFIQQAGRRTFLLHVTSDDTVASLKARLKWPDSRLIKSPLELWDDTRSLGSYGVRKEDTLLLCGRLCGGGVCMGKPTVVAPGENIAPQDAAPAPHAPAAPTAPEEVAAPAALYQAERPARKKAEEEAQREEERRRVAAEAEAQKKAEEERKKTEAERRAAKAALKKAEEEARREEERKRMAAEAEAPAVRARKACVPSVVATENEVAQRHAKLCMDVSGLIRKGKFGGIALFDSTLEEQVGCMDAPALRGMYAEHVMDAASSAAPFSPPNNPSLTCTPEGSLPQGARLYVCARRRGITSEQL